MDKTYEVYGEIQGPIWMPAIECQKEFRIKFELSKDGPFFRPACSNPLGVFSTLREVLLHVTNDGDFQSANISWAFLAVTTHPDERTKQVKTFELGPCIGIEDCFKETA